ncbi:hypothetical protein BT96DRAFT_890838 [Gymnopus androsaceus JB14]|uniref:CHAT domain-containing protein n=1 Tax=Gymnopus androsaceus JB14 TaxID=1447944 RepID=A0A6A4GQ91_9AGAR|nr:hypothetical protein BT96DRAFT_890838 [Gymnopus androsaceus JB14]
MLRYLNGMVSGIVRWFIPGPPEDAASIELDEAIRGGNVAAISNAITSYRQAVKLQPEGDDHRTAYLEGLGIALRSRFELQGDIADLNEAVDAVHEVLQIHPKRVSLSILLADTLRLRFEKSGFHQDLHRAIDVLCSALAKCAPQSVECFSILSDLYLCNSLLVRLSTEHLQAACPIPNLTEFRSPNCESSDYPIALSNMAQAHMYHFYSSGVQDDLERAAELYHKALQVNTSGASRAQCLLGLANVLFVQYEHDGEVKKLQTVIESCVEAFEYVREGSLSIQCQIKLASAYQARFYRDGDAADLQKSFDYLNNALLHCPPGHIHRPSILRSVCWGELHRSNTHTIDDSEKLIHSAKEVLALHPIHHTDRRSCLVLLAGVLYTHFQRVREVEYLNQRLTLLAEALNLCSDTHPDYGRACIGLADAFLERYEWADDRDDMDLDRAIHHGHLATNTRNAPPWRYQPKALLFRYLRTTKQEDDRQAAKDVLVQVCESPYYSYLSRIRIAMQWSSLAQSQGSRFGDLAIVGYEIAIELRSRLASFSLQNAQTRIDNLAETGDRFATRVAALALRTSGAARAIELLEQSRAVFWTQALQLRSTFDGLPDPLKRELQDTAQKLDATPNDHFLTERQVTERKKASARFEALLQQARSLPEFHDLLLPKSYNQLSEASASGPVIILFRDNVALSNCNVIVIRSPRTCPEHFVLSKISTYELNKDLQNFTTRQARESRSMTGDGDDGLFGDDSDSARLKLLKNRQKTFETQYEKFLATLWVQIVKPIMDHLGFKRLSGRNRPRIHWCPTGDYAFLPLHAAGLRFVGSDSECMMNYAVSSYTPTVAALLRAQELSRHISESVDIKVLAVAQPTTPGHSALPKTEEEMHALETILPSDCLIRLHSRGSGHSDSKFADTNSNVTVSQVVEQLPRTSMLHLACHGHQDHACPLDSGFVLEDGLLTVRKLFETQVPHAHLAFLSACSTATGDQNLPDEPIHLGTTMLFAGFPNVIATLWSMSDSQGPEVARDVHTSLYHYSSHTWRLSGDNIAYVLDEAVRKLIERGVKPSRWATYIHIGS